MFNKCNEIFSIKIFLILLPLITNTISLYSQIIDKKVQLKVIKKLENEDSIIIYQGQCRNIIDCILLKNEKLIEDRKFDNLHLNSNLNKDERLSKMIQGNFIYNFNYRSFMDTPFKQNDLIQQTLQIRMRLFITKIIPIQIITTTRKSNSVFFNNNTDIALTYDFNSILQKKKIDYLSKINEELNSNYFLKSPKDYESLNKIKTDLKFKKFGDIELKDTVYKKLEKDFEIYCLISDSIKEIKNKILSLQNPQVLIEKKTFLNVNNQNDRKTWNKRDLEVVENINNKTPNNDSLSQIFFEKSDFEKLKIGSIDSFEQKPFRLSNDEKWIDTIVLEKNKLRLYEKKIDSLEKNIYKNQKQLLTKIQEQKSSISKAKDFNELEKVKPKALNANNVYNEKLNLFEKIVLNFKKIELGRVWLDQSELTLKNIVINGFNLDYKLNKFRIGACGGKINIGTNDFIFNNSIINTGQNLISLNLGLDLKHNTEINLRYYAGNKNLQSIVFNKDSLRTNFVKGLGIEFKKNFDKNNKIAAEYVKSEVMQSGTKILNFNQKNNMAFYLSMENILFRNNLKLNSYYRKIGNQFQSFTLLPTGIEQESWMIKIQHNILNDRVFVDGSIRKNDFLNNSFFETISNNVVFKSLQLSLKIPRYPQLFFGYFPTNQLTISNDKKIYQSQFNTYNAVLNYNYSYKEILLNTNLTISKFDNESGDSSFSMFNATNINFQQTVTIGKFNVQCNFTKAIQANLNFTTIELLNIYQPNKKFNSSLGIKYIVEKGQKANLGLRIGVQWHIFNIGQIQMQYDKIFVPNFYRQLIPIDLGRVTYIREI